MIGEQTKSLLHNLLNHTNQKHKRCHFDCYGSLAEPVNFFGVGTMSSHAYLPPLSTTSDVPVHGVNRREIAS
jgi:hypothetical protein